MPHRTRVLVVDDNKDMVDTLRGVLETAGYDARGINSASTIVADVRDFDPDVIIMDMAMPGRDGWDAAREVRQYRTRNHPMLIAVSGVYTKGAVTTLAEASGFDYYLIKLGDP